MQKLKTVGQNSGVLYTFVGLEDLAKKILKMFQVSTMMVPI